MRVEIMMMTMLGDEVNVSNRVISAVDVSDWCTRHATLKPHSSLD